MTYTELLALSHLAAMEAEHARDERDREAASYWETICESVEELLGLRCIAAVSA